MRNETIPIDLFTFFTCLTAFCEILGSVDVLNLLRRRRIKCLNEHGPEADVGVLEVR